MKKVKIEICPPGICQGAIETLVEKYIGYWPYHAVGERGRRKDQEEWIYGKKRRSKNE